jgi:hypothetical protein
LAIFLDSSFRVPGEGQGEGLSVTHNRGAAWLTTAAAASVGVALLHVWIPFTGTWGYEYFGAPRRFVELSRGGSAVPALVTLVIALVFAVFGLYALSGASRAPRLPIRRIALVGISGIYLLRGLIVFPELILFLYSTVLPARRLAFSLVALAIGVVYTVGTARRWPALG